MSEYKKEDIKNLHYNNNNEIQYEYGGQIYHCSMEHLKEVLVTCWNLQQEKQQLKEKYEELQEAFKKAITTEHHKIHALLDIIDEVKTAVDYMIGNADISEIHGTKLKQILDKIKEN